MVIMKENKKIDQFINNEIEKQYLLLRGDCLDIIEDMPPKSINCVITSPPYWQQRKYSHENGDKYIVIGDEKKPEEYVANLKKIFSEIKRVLADDGSLWLNLGDKYFNKNLMGMPWRVALALQDDGWILRNDIIWDQMKGTQSAKDRMRNIHEHVFHFVKKKKYYYAHNEIRIKPPVKAKNKNGVMISATGVSGKKYFKQIKESTVLTDIEKKNALTALKNTIEEMKEGKVVDFRMTIRGNQRTYHSDQKKISGRAKDLEKNGFYIIKMRSTGHLPSDIWRIVPEDQWRKDAHYAVFPEALLDNPIKATCPPGGIVMDLFSGIGSTVNAALKLKRRGIGIDISRTYNDIAEKRIKETIGG